MKVTYTLACYACMTTYGLHITDTHMICAKLSSCVIAKLARMHIFGRMRTCVIAKLAWMQIYANMILCVSAILARAGDSIGLFVASRKSTLSITRNSV